MYQNHDLFSLKRVHLPLHFDNNHWALGVINVEKKRIEMYDSLGMGVERRFEEFSQVCVSSWSLFSLTRT
jgi:Ulp1 family protease